MSLFPTDGAGSLIAANGDGIPDSAHSVHEPNSSDDYIVTKTVYDPRLSATGPIVDTIDNAGRVTETQSDFMGRTLLSIQSMAPFSSSVTSPIATLDWRGMALHSGVLREPPSEPDRLIVWVAAERDGNCRHWQRISTVPRAAVVQHANLSTMAATAIGARQQARGIFSGLVRRFRRHAEDLALVLPNGEAVQQCGERQTGLLLVRSEGGAKGSEVESTNNEAL